jgi:hypothetical protein
MRPHASARMTDLFTATTARARKFAGFWSILACYRPELRRYRQDIARYCAVR